MAEAKMLQNGDKPHSLSVEQFQLRHHHDELPPIQKQTSDVTTTYDSQTSQGSSSNQSNIYEEILEEMSGDQIRTPERCSHQRYRTNQCSIGSQTYNQQPETANLSTNTQMYEGKYNI